MLLSKIYQIKKIGLLITGILIFSNVDSLNFKKYDNNSGIINSFKSYSEIQENKSSNMDQARDKMRLNSEFISSSVKIDGIIDNEWEKAGSSVIEIKMTADLSSPAADCTTSGTVRSLWNGSLLFLLLEVTDSDINFTGRRPTDKDGVEIYLDLWNDKVPKNEEDDGIIRISGEGELTGSGVYADRLNSFAASLLFENGKKVGYIVELALNIGGVPQQNGTKIGMDFCIIDATTPDNAGKYRIFWNNADNKGLDDNSRWGTVALAGYESGMAKALDKFVLNSTIKKAEDITRGIWVTENDLDNALSEAKKALSSTHQETVDEANKKLEGAINKLRRKGKYPDPFDLPTINYLPDPFTFFNGEKVRTLNDWNLRRDEIKDLVQYYEYGYMPDPPENVTADINEEGIVKIMVYDKGKTASFDGKLTLPTKEQCGKEGPYPVVVSIDFWAGEANPIFLEAGYAVLSIIYSTIASDNSEHKGAFYSLYPYDLTTENDAGTLLAWAWGAGRGIDALKYLTETSLNYSNLDLGKLAVSGFSRCGKAALIAGLFDERFGVVNPGASGSGGAAVYRYDSFGNTPFRSAPYGNVYPWGTSTGCEVLGDRIRHQGHNSNEMLARFLNPGRMYKTETHGYGERLPYDHHEIITAIAPRAVIITSAADDYANGVEGDCIAVEGAKSVFRFLNAKENLALNIREAGVSSPNGFGGAHRVDDSQIKNLVSFMNKVFFDIPLDNELKTKFYTNPYLSTFDKYYGGINTMMPWINSAPD